MQGVGRAFLVTNSSERTEGQQKAFVAAAQATGVQHLVKLSQLHAAVGSPVRFLRYHAAVEAAIEESGVPHTFVRPNLILQAYLPFAPLIQAGVLQAPIEEARVSIVDARDIAALVAAALTEDGHEGHTYDVTGPEASTHAELAAAFGEAAGHEVRFESVPPEAFLAAWSRWECRPGRPKGWRRTTRTTDGERRPASPRTSSGSLDDRRAPSRTSPPSTPPRFGGADGAEGAGAEVLTAARGRSGWAVLVR